MLHCLDQALAQSGCTGDRLLAPLISEDSCSSDQRCFFPMLSNENNFNLSASTVGGNWTHMVHVLCTVI